jgi:hypothetical protein
MALSFTYFLNDFPNSTPDAIQVFLNGTEIADVMATSNSIESFQTVITDPALENLSNAVIMFKATSTDPSGDFVDIGNISLTAVPEPASAALIIIGTSGLLCRHRRSKRRQG